LERPAPEGSRASASPSVSACHGDFASFAALTAIAAIAVAFLLAVLIATSLMIGASDVSIVALLLGEPSAMAQRVLIISRIPRTAALVLAGVSMAVAGSIMQMLARNRFVEPSTAGTVESAGLGLLCTALLIPDLAPIGKVAVATVFALVGTSLFLLILQRIPLRSALVVPLVGLVLGGVIDSVTTFIAYRTEMLQSVSAWRTGDFSAVLLGRYELLWLSLVLAAVAWFVADRFTMLGLGEAYATNAGLRHGPLIAIGLVVIAIITATVTVTAGVIPFLGLIVPNVVSLMLGDNLRRTLPWIAALGACFVLTCDIIGRAVIHPYEIPIGTVVGIVGSALFLVLLLRGRARLG